MDRHEDLMILRNIFYKCFFIGLLFLIAAALLYMPCKCVVANVYQAGLGINSVAYDNMWVAFVGLIKTVLVFFFLVPALAIHSTARAYENKHSKKEL